MSCRFVTGLLVIVSIMAWMAMPFARAQENENAYRTTGPVAEAPVKVGCWTAFEIETPPYIFPMVYEVWSAKNDTAESYANRVIAEIRRRPKDQPIWLQTHGWFGNYKPRDPSHAIAHEKDVTAAGTPGIWPKVGLDLWRGRQQEFLQRLHDAGCRLDAWPLDNETGVHKWSRNYRFDNTWINIVRDPRWESEPILGVWKPGSHFVSRKKIEAADDPNEAAHAIVSPLGTFMRDYVFDEYFAKPVLAMYPHAEVSDYGRVPGRGGRWYAPPETVMSIEREANYLTQIQGVGNRSAIVLYGGRDNSVDRVGMSLAVLDRTIEDAGGPQKVTPWLAPPNNCRYAYNWQTKEMIDNGPEKRRFTDEEWERLVLGCVERGVRHFLLWNTPLVGHNKPECERTMVEVFEKATKLAERLDARAAEMK